MAFKYSTAFKNSVCTENSVQETFDGSVINVYSGPVPATPDTALSGNTLLCTYSDNDTGGGLNLATTAINGTVSKLGSQIWKGTAVATGEATFFRAEKAGGIVIQGLVGQGADLNVASTTYTSGNEYLIDVFTISFLDL